MSNNIFKTIYKNLSSLLIAEVGIRAMMLALTIYIARVYSPAQFGIYTLALSAGSLFEIIFNMGLNTVFLQRVAARKEDAEKELSIFLPLRLTLSLISFCLFLIFTFALQKDFQTFYALVLGGAYFSLLSIISFLWGCFDANQKMHFTAGAKFIIYIIICALGFYFIATQKPIYYILYAYIAGVIVATFFTILWIHKYFVKLKINCNISEWKKIISEGWPIALGSTFVFVYNYLDTILISIAKGEEAVGLYQVSYKVIGTIFILSMLINQAYLPSFIETHHKNPEHLNKIFDKTMQAIFFWCIPITVGGLLYAEKIILMVFGEKYMGGIGAFKILIWNCIIFFFSSAMSNFLYALKKQRSMMKVFFIGAIVNTVLNIFIIPIFGIQGAALTTILAEFVVMLCTYFLTKKFIEIKIAQNILPAIAASCIMAFILIVVQFQNIFIAIPLGGLIYLALYFPFKKALTSFMALPR